MKVCDPHIEIMDNRLGESRQSLRLMVSNALNSALTLYLRISHLNVRGCRNLRLLSLDVSELLVLIQIARSGSFVAHKSVV